MKRTERQRSAGVFDAARWWAVLEQMIAGCWTGGRPGDAGAGRVVCHQAGMICCGRGGGALRGVPAGMGSRARSNGEGKTFPNGLFRQCLT